MALWAGAAIASGVLVGCIEQSAETPSEDDVKAARENVLAAPPASMKFPVNANLDGKLVYLGMDIDTDTITPGRAFTLTHYWKVNEPVGGDWRLFVHLEAPGSKASHLNADHTPVAGKYPVALWKKGEIIRDIHRASVPSSWHAPQVEIYTGIWKGAQRLKVTSGPSDSENRVLVARIPVAAAAAAPVQKRLVAWRVKPRTVKLDGKIDEPAWKATASTGPFVRTLDGTPAAQHAEAKALWDDKNLYVAFQLADKDVWSTLDKRDDKLWTQEAVEVFIDADGDGKTYVELQTNPRGAIFDSYLPAYRQNQNDFDAGVKVAVQVDGTVDLREDQDRGWTVEMQIPFEAARGKEKEMKNVPPAVGTSWRVNFFRMDLPAGKAQEGSSWSPPLVPDFHALDKFGMLVFGDEAGVTEVKAAAAGDKAAGPDKAGGDKAAGGKPVAKNQAEDKGTGGKGAGGKKAGGGKP
ncbi:MAG TPA: carbohydrate-binding family 9-like protein [Polyangia bacterium]|nr:carbohydrate-binding family 9-like protein [Polyangia bacterium]